MGFFRRTPEDVAAAVEPEPENTAASDRSGPWDVHDDPPNTGYLDLGGLRVPALPGLKLQLDSDKKRRVILVRVQTADSELQLAPFAAPRSSGIWDEIRAEIAEQILSDGGTVDHLTGTFGPELRTSVVVKADGRTGRRTVRFMGVDGPRWFLRGVVTGAAATDPEAAAKVDKIFAGCVVVRGDQAMPPRDLLAMHLPDQVPQSEPEEPVFDPLARGPEITETR